MPREFSERVLEIAEMLSTPPFQDRVAIAQIYDEYGRIYPSAGSLASFKERLVEATKNRGLELGRLDLPERMDNELRDRSAAVWGREEVHFVIRSPQALRPRSEPHEAAVAALTLARAVMATFALREDTYDQQRGRYGLNYFDAAEKAGVDPALRTMTSILLQTGFADVTEWAQTVLEKQNEADLKAWEQIERQADASTPIQLWPDVDLSDPAELRDPSTQQALRHNENIRLAARLCEAETKEEFRARHTAIAGNATVTAGDAAQIALILSVGPTSTRADAFAAIGQWGRGLPSEVSPFQPGEFEHFSALRAAGHDEKLFHAAFTRLEKDIEVSNASLARVADAYIRIPQGEADRTAILGGIENTFYAARGQARATQGQQQGGKGR